MERYLTRRIVSEEITKATPVIDALMLSAKNVHNSTIFIINNIISSYIYNADTNGYQLQVPLHDNQQLILDLINQEITKYNQKNLSKTNKSGNAVKALDLFTQQISSSTLYQVLNHTLIEHTLKSAEALKPNSQRAYANTHSYIAQYVLQKTVDDFKHYFKALRTYYKNKTAFTGRPNGPYYSNKNDRCTIELNLSRLRQDGTLMQIEKLDLYRMYPDKNAVTIEEKQAYTKIDFKKLIDDDLLANNVKGTPKTIRFVSLNNTERAVKVEYVVEIDAKEKGACALMLKQNEKFFDLKAEEQLSLVSTYYDKKQLPRITGIDLGYTNWVTLTYSNKNAGDNRVVSAQNYLKQIDCFDEKIDLRKSELAKESTDYQKLSKRRLDKEKLTRAEKFKLSQHERYINSDPYLRKLWKDKSHYIKDFLHKLSNAIIEDAITKKSQYIVVGKNKFWKQELNLGRKTNRKGHNLPHSRLIEILKYKARLNGIVVIETEESYTSKTCFITDEELKQYAPDTDGKTTHSQLMGKRNKLIFKIGNKRYHADINGSFNIIRKVFKNFAYNKKTISLRYVLSELKLYGKKYFYEFYNSCTGNGNTITC